MERFVTISGCSGGGKSTLLAELSQRGFATVSEPGRRIVAEEQRKTRAQLPISESALPWVNLAAFAERAIEIALANRLAASHLSGWVFFDRGLIDAAAALEHATGQAHVRRFAKCLCHHQVFLAPPWQAIFRTDSERRHGWEEAVAEYDRLSAAYAALDYELVVLPRCSVADRADFILRRLEAS